MPQVNGRGFLEFAGETIVYVDTTAVNVAHFHTKSGKIISVDGESQGTVAGIPIVCVGDWTTPSEKK